ncbi:MAG: hypothetical protein H8E45_10030 [Proteobacteria bacterium]|nr:hypothetical protein [Pseudomonadota bacterium]
MGDYIITKHGDHWIRSSTLIAGVALFVGLQLPATAIAEPIRIEVDAEQRTTLVGASSSLKMLISDLCIRAGVELASYDAADRPVRASYERLPLHEVLPRLLRQESHTLRLRSQGDQLRVSRLEVLGTKTSRVHNRRQTSSTATGNHRLWLPRSLMEAAFASPSVDRREKAVLAIGEYIAGDEQRYSQFLAADAEWMARAIRGYPYARQMLVELRENQGGNAVAKKVAAIILALENLPEPSNDTLQERVFLSRTSP